MQINILYYDYLYKPSANLRFVELNIKKKLKWIQIFIKTMLVFLFSRNSDCLSLFVKQKRRSREEHKAL